MLRSRLAFGLALSLLFGPCPAADAPATMSINGPTAIGIFPPTSQQDLANDDGGLNEGIAHVQFALEDVRNCMKPRFVASRFEFARSIVIEGGEKRRQIDFPSDWQHAIAIVLVTPGKEPTVVYATNGPSGLIEMAPQAAWKYFNEPNCKRWDENDTT